MIVKPYELDKIKNDLKFFLFYGKNEGLKKHYINQLLENNKKTLLLLGGSTLMEKPLEVAGRIKAKTGADVLAEGMNTRIQRGVGRLPVIRIPYPVPQALKILKDYQQIILVGAADPVGFFAYPGKPSRLAPESCHVHLLATPAQECEQALEALCDGVGANNVISELQKPNRPDRSTGAITLDSIASAIGALLPENAIVVDESVTTGRGFLPFTAGAAPHDWLQNRGGAIGLGLPMATGAAIACPDRKVICLESDGMPLQPRLSCQPPRLPLAASPR